jgi:hypothetical protein
MGLPSACDSNNNSSKNYFYGEISFGWCGIGIWNSLETVKSSVLRPLRFEMCSPSRSCVKAGERAGKGIRIYILQIP